ncbi:hypothetical protein Anapl_07483 [Anas platyrhynchos]|uniref:Uncharacterized protein n=1 Tax=Anas platyrhynchos TaxID=8839 RepID=R0KFY6_ANAPL|nr:hypothetical protein Anapl_07483 [Anas platyrhynchos]
MLKRQKHLLLSLLVFAKKKDQLHSEGKETWGCPGTALRSVFPAAQPPGASTEPLSEHRVPSIEREKRGDAASSPTSLPCIPTSPPGCGPGAKLLRCTLHAGGEQGWVDAACSKLVPTQRVPEAVLKLSLCFPGGLEMLLEAGWPHPSLNCTAGEAACLQHRFQLIRHRSRHFSAQDLSAVLFSSSQPGWSGCFMEFKGLGGCLASFWQSSARLLLTCSMERAEPASLNVLVISKTHIWCFQLLQLQEWCVFVKHISKFFGSGEVESLLEVAAGTVGAAECLGSCWTSPKPRELTARALVVARERLLESVSAAGVEGLVEVPAAVRGILDQRRVCSASGLSTPSPVLVL